MISDFLLHFLIGSMVMTALWSAASLILVKLVRLHSPTARFLVFLAPLVAAFVARARLSSTMMRETVAICFAVAILLLCRDLYRYHTFRRRIEAEAEPSADLQRVVDGLARSFEISAPRVLLSEDSSVSPFTGGLTRPFIVVPRSILSALSAEEVNLLLAHEMAHVRRKDILWKWLILFLRHLSILNPAASWSYRQLNLEIERGCDRSAISVTRKPGTLARTLLKVEEFLSQMSPSADQYIPETISRAGSYLPLRIQSLNSLHDRAGLWANLAKLGFIFFMFRLICFQPVELWLKFLK
ncbi:MAG: M56 family metallopeptidase [Nitrospirota bacterium]